MAADEGQKAAEVAAALEEQKEPASKRKRAPPSEKYSAVPEADGTAPRWTRFPVRVRAHRNPLADNDDEHPTTPGSVEWRSMYPAYATGDGEGMKQEVEICDIGCAYGGLLCRLSSLYPETLMLGMEIRDKVVSFSQGRVQRLRDGLAEDPSAAPQEGGKKHHYNNVWFVQCNAMKYLPNYFRKGQLRRLFFCYPDPHWKRKNHRRRIIQPALVQEYAYVLGEGGLLYTCTDVEELSIWMIEKLDGCPLFQRVMPDELEDKDRLLLDHVKDTSEDALRSEKRKLTKHFSIHRRLPDPPF